MQLETLPDQMNIFNEIEMTAAEVVAEFAIEQVVVIRKKKGQRKESLGKLPRHIENRELTKEQLKPSLVQTAGNFCRTKCTAWCMADCAKFCVLGKLSGRVRVPAR